MHTEVEMSLTGLRDRNKVMCLKPRGAGACGWVGGEQELCRVEHNSGPHLLSGEATGRLDAGRDGIRVMLWKYHSDGGQSEAFLLLGVEVAVAKNRSVHWWRERAGSQTRLGVEASGPFLMD